MTVDADRPFPICRAEFLEAAVRLRRDHNLTVSDIASLLHLSTHAVLELLHLADTGHEQFGTNTYSRRARSES